MQVLFSLKEATAAQIREQLANPPTGNAVRATLQILENKGLVKRDRKEGREFIFQPTETSGTAGVRALKQVLETFFNGSISTALAAHLTKEEKLDTEDIERLQQLIEEAKEEEQR